MGLFRFLKPVSSAPVARERLQILLEYERRMVSQTSLITTLKEEILAVVSRHVAIDPERIHVSVDRGDGFSTLAVGVQIPNNRNNTTDELVQAVYTELKRLAAAQLAGERPGHTLQPTALVHEAYLRLAQRTAGWGKPHRPSMCAGNSHHKHFQSDGQVALGGRTSNSVKILPARGISNRTHNRHIPLTTPILRTGSRELRFMAIAHADPLLHIGQYAQ